MAKDAWTFIFPLALAMVIASFWSTLLSAFFLLLILFVVYFFRNPERHPPDDPDAIVSPADGKIVLIEPSGEFQRVSIFLSPFDVHVNRAPIAGRMARADYRKGKFLVASNHRASVENEQCILTVSDGRRELTFALIAGILARRIILWKKKDDAVLMGERVALIRFGSRSDIYVPPSAQLLVKKGDRVRAGETVVARFTT